MTSNVVLSTQNYKIVGTRPIRHDGTDKVTGRARFGADINVPRLLHGKVLRCPHAHARIKSIDVSRALALPGVKAAVTSADFPVHSGDPVDLGEGIMSSLRFLTGNSMAGGKALYKGHAVAAVAATNSHIAEEAVALIDVDYEVLAPVLDVREAMKDGSPLLHDEILPAAWGQPSEKPSNTADSFVFETGEMEKGFAKADLIVEREYTTIGVHQGYIEPLSCTAAWNADSELTIWCCTQGHFERRTLTADILGMPVSKINVIATEIGGGFGGKQAPYLEPVAAVLSRKTGHPVKMTMSRSEVFEGTGPTSGSYMWVRMGVTNAGRITAAEAHLAFEAGAYPGSAVIAAAMCIFAPYDIPNARVNGYDVVVNKPKVEAYRAPGAPQAAFAVETVIDEICETLGMDPLEFRLLNGAKEGTQRLIGGPFQRIGILETVKAAKEHGHYSAPLQGPNRGRGVAGGYWINGSGPSTATVSVNADGTVSLIEGSPDIGGTRTAVAMQLAEVLGIPVEDVKPEVGDTNAVGFTSTTNGSSVTFKTGWACYEAGHDVRRQMVQRAATIWDVPPDDVDYSDGVLAHKSDPELRLTFKELAGMLNGTGGPISGRGTVDPQGVGGAFAAHIVDVEVDPDTGKVEILRYTALQDAGKAVHPSYVEGQMQGGVAQGIGWALSEEYFFNDKGEMVNSSFLDYRMPTSLDLPMIDTVIVEVANPGHPFGVRGVGEVPIVPPMAAIANAIHNAVGVRMRGLPMSPGKLLQALWDQKRPQEKK